MNHYPRGFLPALLLLLGLILLSGLGLAPTTLSLRLDWSLPWRASGSARVWIAALHSAAAFALAAVVGALWSVHMRSGWRRRRQRYSGALLAALAVLLAGTAVGVYYLGDDRWASAAALVHLVAGVAGSAVFLLHWLGGRRAGRRHRRHRRAHAAERSGSFDA